MTFSRRIVNLFLVFISSTTLAQNATVSGKVTDVNGESIPFANVVAVEHGVGSSTDFDGNFRFTVPTGKCTIYCSFVGYKNDTIVVQLSAGQKYQKNFVLRENDNNLQEIEVIATRRTNTELAVMMEVKQAKQIVNAISAEMIEKTQDSDASEVVKRIPGVTVVGNNFIMIRGLSERYNNVMLHDVFAPSMETDVKSFAFDIIPSNMIDRILIFKSPAPEITGEFAGGVVKIYTKGIPDTTFTSVSVSSTYRNGTSFKDFKQPRRSGWHWTGFNDGYNDMPDGIPGNIGTQQDPQAIQEYGQSFKNNWTPNEGNALTDLSVSITHGHKMKWGKVDVGNISAITYSNNKTVFNSERSDYNAYDHINDRSQYIYTFKDEISTQNIRTGFLHNWAFRLNGNNTIEFKNMFNVFSTTEYVSRTGYDYEFNYAPDNHSLNQVYRGLYSGQLLGKHTSKNELTKFNWTVGYGYSYRDQPDYRRYRSDVDTLNRETLLFVGVPLSPNYLGRFFSEMRENSQSAALALEQRIKSEKWDPKFKAGLFFERKYRDFNARNIGFVQSNFMFFDQNLLYGNIEELFTEENINPTTGIKVGESTNPSDSYQASNLLTAGYLGAELPFLNRFNLNAGVRTEYNIQELNSRNLSGIPIVVDNPILSILPSANLTYDLIKDKMLLRAAYGKTVNRPEFRELAPFGFYDFNFNLVKKGSDTLRTPVIHNFDFRWEYYPKPGEMITVSFFYKQFKDPIETLFVPGGGSGGIKTFTFGNARLATSIGTEVEFKKSLEGLFNWDLFKGVAVLFNGSLIKSHVDLGLEQLGQSNQRPMQGQSPYIVNAGLFYQNDKHDFSVNVLYNVIGERIFIIGFDVYPDIYQMPRNVLDVNFTKKFKNNIELKLGLGDIINQEYLLLQDANADGVFSRTDDQVIQRYKPGMTVSFGFGYKF
jgi:hypothetical protein